MSQQHNSPGMAVPVAQATAAYLLVKWDGTLCAADANIDWIGVSQDPASPNPPFTLPPALTPAGFPIPVRFTRGRTCIMTAAAAVAKGALVYKAAAGQVGVTNTNALVGMAVEAASGAGAQFEVLGL